MPLFVVSGRASDGKEVTEEISAPSGDAAVSLLQSKGYTDVRLHSHEWSEAIEWDTIRHTRKLPAGIPQRDRFRFGTMSPREFLRYLLVRQLTRPLVVVPAGFLIVRLVAGMSLGPVDAIALGLLIIPFAHAAYLGLWGSSVVYHRIQKADAWGKWQVVLDLLPSVKSDLAPSEYAFRQARALVGLGRISEAMAVVKPVEGALPKPMYQCRLATLFGAANDEKKAREALEVALDAAPNDPLVLLSYAEFLAGNGIDLDRAEALLNQAKSHAIIETLRAGPPFVEGMLAVQRGEGQRGLALLEQALALMPKPEVTPLILATMAYARAFKAMAFFGIGDVESARDEYARAVPVLAARNDAKFIARCEAILGVTGGQNRVS